MRRLEFWYEFASTYSYLSAMRIESLAGASGIEVLWRPFLLGPIFKAQSWDTSPFNIYPDKGTHMVRDMERITAERDLPFVMPTRFPAHSLLAARLALSGEQEGWTPRFSRSVYTAEFGFGDDVSEPSVMRRILTELGVDAESALRAASEPAHKERLKQRTTAAAQRRIFGAPSFVTSDGELFWGDDRLEQALRWETEASRGSGN